MRITHIYRQTGEVGIFLIHLFILQTAGRWFFIGLLWLLRIFGMPSFYFSFYASPNAKHWLSTILLIIAVGVSVGRILKLKKK